MPRFLPSLRGKASPAYSPTALPEVQGKALYTDYYSALAQYASSTAAQRPWSIERAVTEGYERIVWGFKAIQAISGASSALQYRLRSGDDVIDDDPVCQLLNVQANPLETGWVFRKRLSAQALLSKPGVFVEITRSNRGTPIRYDLLPPTGVKIVPGSGGVLVDHYELWVQGRKARDLPPDNVHWIRDPHPVDPYSGVTPLEAAGMSIELDHFARLYNVTYLRNDGRPGGIVGVGTGDDVDDSVLDAIERRFDKGPHNAGKLTAIAGELSYVDLGSKPRDAQYGTLAQNAKDEILCAFGTPESQIGNAASRTYANAEAEGYAFWTQTMAQHNRLIASAFEIDSPAHLRGFLDTSEIEVLQAPQRARRQEALAEFNAGLRSIKSYADLAGYGAEIADMPETRALYLPSGKTPIAARADDKKALGLDTSAAGGAALPPAPGSVPPGQAAAAAVDRIHGARDGTQPAARATLERIGATPPVAGTAPPGAGTAARALAAAATRPALPAAPAAAASVGPSLFGKHGGPDVPREVKARPALRLVVGRPKAAGKASGQWRESETDEAHAAAVEDALTAALEGLVDRWVERTAARVHAPKARKGTRHFTPEHAVDTRIGTRALDAPRIVDEDRFAAEAQALAFPILADAVAAAGASLASDLGIEERAAGAGGPDPLPVLGVSATVAALIDGDGAGRPGLSVWLWRYLRARVLGPLLEMVGGSARRAAARLTTTVNIVDQAGGAVVDIEAEVRAWGTVSRAWARGLAETATTAAVEGGRTETVTALTDDETDVQRVWRTRRDGKVRASHADADGQRRGVGEPFDVGDALLRWPGDPQAPVVEVARCRCRLTIRSRVSGRFLPAARDTTHARATAGA